MYTYGISKIHTKLRMPVSHVSLLMRLHKPVKLSLTFYKIILTTEQYTCVIYYHTKKNFSPLHYTVLMLFLL